MSSVIHEQLDNIRRTCDRGIALAYTDLTFMDLFVHIRDELPRIKDELTKLEAQQ